MKVDKRSQPYKGRRLGSRETLSCDRCSRAIKYRICEYCMTEEESEYFARGMAYMKKVIDEGVPPVMIEKEVDEFSGAVKNSKCLNCEIVANFDLEASGHVCKSINV